MGDGLLRAMHVGVLCALVALSAAAMTSGKGSLAASRANGPTLVVGRDLSDAVTLDPGRLLEVTDEAVDCNVYDTLVAVVGRDVSHIRPALATRWTVSNHDRVYTFYLRHNVRFSTGDPMTAADVVFSYRRLGYLLDNPSFLMGAAKVKGRMVIDRVEALDKYRVRFTLPEPDISFLAALVDINFGVLDAKAVMAHGGDDSAHAAARDKATPWLNAHSAGTGAFVLSSWQRGGTGQVVLKRNPYYWGPRPSLSQVIFQGIPSSTTQLLAISRGTIDVASNITIDGATSLARDRNVSTVTGKSLDLVYLAMTTRSTISRPLSARKVRQAVRAALDYNGIIKGLLRDQGTRPNSAIPVGMVGNDPATNARLKPRTDPRLARRLLKQAGYPHGFTVTLTYPGGATLDGIPYDVLAPKVAHDLGTVGIRVRLRALELSALLPAFRAGKEAITLWFFGFDFPDTNAYAANFASGGFVARHVWYTWNPEEARLATQADSTSNVVRRGALYRQLQQSWLRQGPWATIVQPRGITVLHHGITNYRYSPVFPSNFRSVRKA